MISRSLQSYFFVFVDSYFFSANVAVPPTSQMEAIKSRDLPKVGNTCAILAVVGSAGKSNMPSWVAVMVVLSGRMSFGPDVIGFTLSNGASLVT